MLTEYPLPSQVSVPSAASWIANVVRSDSIYTSEHRLLMLRHFASKCPPSNIWTFLTTAEKTAYKTISLEKAKHSDGSLGTGEVVDIVSQDGSSTTLSRGSTTDDRHPVRAGAAAASFFAFGAASLAFLPVFAAPAVGVLGARYVYRKTRRLFGEKTIDLLIPELIESSSPSLWSVICAPGLPFRAVEQAAFANTGHHMSSTELWKPMVSATGCNVLHVSFEPSLLSDFHNSVDTIISRYAANASSSLALKVFASTIASAIALPSALLGMISVADSPLSLLLDRSTVEKGGRLLYRMCPILRGTVVSWSIGSRLMINSLLSLSALEEEQEKNEYASSLGVQRPSLLVSPEAGSLGSNSSSPLQLRSPSSPATAEISTDTPVSAKDVQWDFDHLVLIGSPVLNLSSAEWEMLLRRVRGSIVVAYSDNDWYLGVVVRALLGIRREGVSQVLGVAPLLDGCSDAVRSRVILLPVGDLIATHLQYADVTVLLKIVQRCQQTIGEWVSKARLIS
eukprot:ANDGO_06304.mRNA.1 hypothetical protein